MGDAPAPIPCPGCKRPVSPRAKSCLYCRAPIAGDGQQSDPSLHAAAKNPSTRTEAAATALSDDDLLDEGWDSQPKPAQAQTTASGAPTSYASVACPICKTRYAPAQNPRGCPKCTKVNVTVGAPVPNAPAPAGGSLPFKIAMTVIAFIVLGVVGGGCYDSVESPTPKFGGGTGLAVLAVFVGLLLASGVGFGLVVLEERLSEREPTLQTRAIATGATGIVGLVWAIPWMLVVLDLVNARGIPRPFSATSCEVTAVNESETSLGTMATAKVACELDSGKKLEGAIPMRGERIASGTRVGVPMARGRLGVWIRENEGDRFVADPKSTTRERLK
jgi:hypothetical protein